MHQILAENNNFHNSNKKLKQDFENFHKQTKMKINDLNSMFNMVGLNRPKQHQEQIISPGPKLTHSKSLKHDNRKVILIDKKLIYSKINDSIDSSNNFSDELQSEDEDNARFESILKIKQQRHTKTADTPSSVSSTRSGIAPSQASTSLHSTKSAIVQSVNKSLYEIPLRSNSTYDSYFKATPTLILTAHSSKQFSSSIDGKRLIDKPKPPNGKELKLTSALNTNSSNSKSVNNSPGVESPSTLNETDKGNTSESKSDLNSSIATTTEAANSSFNNVVLPNVNQAQANKIHPPINKKSILNELNESASNSTSQSQSGGRKSAAALSQNSIKKLRQILKLDDFAESKPALHKKELSLFSKTENGKNTLKLGSTVNDVASKLPVVQHQSTKKDDKFGKNANVILIKKLNSKVDPSKSAPSSNLRRLRLKQQQMLHQQQMGGSQTPYRLTQEESKMSNDMNEFPIRIIITDRSIAPPPCTPQLEVHKCDNCLFCVRELSIKDKMLRGGWQNPERTYSSLDLKPSEAEKPKNLVFNYDKHNDFASSLYKFREKRFT
jgi:hypothetical protein